MEQKRGISPLLSAVILILILVSIAALVSVFLRGMAEENVDQINEEKVEMTCGIEVNLKPVLIDSTNDICANSTTVKGTLINRGSKDLYDLGLQVIGDADIYNNESYGVSLDVGQSKIITLPYDSTGLGNIRQIKILPIISQPTGSAYICSDRAVTIDSDEIRQCTT